MPNGSNAMSGSPASPTVPPTAPPAWTARDTESVSCCVCGADGVSVYRLPPFGVVRCPVCELVFVSPRLTSSALQRIWTAGRLAEIARLRPPPARLLEIGSGYGLFLAAARDAGFAVRGVELSRTGVEQTRRRLGVDVFAGQLAEAPIGEADVVCFWDTLEHVPDPLAFLREVRGRLAHDGVFALSVPYISSCPGRLLGTSWWTLKPEQHLWQLTPTTLRLVAARAGLVISRMVVSPIRRANAGRIDSLVAFGRAIPDGRS